ncbi:putative ankyrin repeat protein [Paramyrothecium foliicola]|nr:putative ankyrin repeat protein [Paramyrothecium foliicola]
MEGLPQETVTNIAQFLSRKDLFNFLLTNTRLTGSILRVLYRHDAASLEPKAIHWAVQRLRRLDEGPSNEVAVITMKTAKKYRGNFNLLQHYDVQQDLYLNEPFLILPSEARCTTPIAVAVALGHVDMVKTLLEMGADPSILDKGLHDRSDMRTTKIDHYASKLGLGSNLREGFCAPILKPICANDTEMVELLLGNGAGDVVAQKPGVFTLRMIHLLAVGALPGLDHSFVLQAAKHVNKPLLPTGSRRGMPLSMAINGGEYEFAERLLTQGADPNIPDERHQPPIFSVIRRCHTRNTTNERGPELEMLRSLIINGADVNWGITSSIGTTPLMAAVQPTERTPTTIWGDMKKMVEELVNSGAQINQASADGNTPLLYVCRLLIRKGDNDSLINIVKYFVEKGGDLNTPFPNGPSILHRVISCLQGRWKFFKLLVEKKASINPGEADSVLSFWIRNPRLRNARLDLSHVIAQVKAHATRGAIIDAYNFAKSQKPDSKRDAVLKWLHEVFPTKRRIRA